MPRTDSERVVLTEKSVCTLALPEKGAEGQRIVWDGEAPGFGVRLNFGSRAYVVQGVTPDGRDLRRTIAPAGKERGAVPLREARKTAREWLARIAKGEDPAPPKRAPAAPAAGTTFADARTEFLAAYPTWKKRRSPRTVAEVERHLHRAECDAWAAKGLTEITDEDIRVAAAAIRQRIAERAGKLEKKRARIDGDLRRGEGVDVNRWLSAVSVLFKWAGSTWRAKLPAIKDYNPVASWGGDLRVEDNGRERGIDETDLPKIWRAVLARGRLWGRLYRLLMLLGCRRSELEALKWSEVKSLHGADPHIDKGTLTKAGRKLNRRIPLPPRAVRLLERVPNTGLYVFGGSDRLNSRSDVERDIRKVAGLAYGWQPHSFRACLASWAARNGEPASIVEVALGHVTAYRRGAMRAYVDELPRADHRRLLEKWGEHVAALVKGGAAK
jgi:integrase